MHVGIVLVVILCMVIGLLAFFNLSAGAKTVWQKKSASVSWRKVGA